MLKITYKIFSRMLYNSLRVAMDEKLPNDQTGFRPNTGIDDASVVLECLSSKSLEWNASRWFENLDLTKAFDCIEYSPLFDALLQQGVPHCYCTLLLELYKGQTGSIHASERFNIERRVKQVMSSAQYSSMQDWNMPCENGTPSCFIMGCSLGMVTG